MQRVVVCVANVSPGVRDRLERVRLQERAQRLRRNELTQSRAGQAVCGAIRGDLRGSGAGVGQPRSQIQITRIELVSLDSASIHAIQLQEVALRTHIGGGDCHRVGHLTLDTDSPVYVLRRAAAKVRVGIRHARGCCLIAGRAPAQGIGGVAGAELRTRSNASRARVGGNRASAAARNPTRGIQKSRHGGHIVRRRERRPGREAQRSDGIGKAAHSIAVGEHDTVAGANHGLAAKLIGKADARAKVFEVVLDRGGTVAGSGAGTRELEGSIEAGHRVGKIGVEEAREVMHFGCGREEIVAQAQVESQVRRHLPVVLDIGRNGAEARAVLRMDGIVREAALVDLAEHEAGVGQTGAGQCCIGAFCNARGLRYGGGEGNGGSSARGANRVVLHPCNLPTEGERVLAYGPLQVIESREVCPQGHIGSCAAPIRWNIRACEGHDWEGLLRLAYRESSHAHG